ncbi:sodium-independent anion transporter [filamentous cyanobacterium LEGE 11480]|uniref:Sodium-independent anion transporter n=1 Tax=Romeriopsis navalis LEGE 11480 TaxID=2777977 RepID=A0A928VPD6_9CYAN|nr:sodium-independent anion transporter [Romeriopsis navalis]MBE9030097.1 sodium-independent anion transporter [Romeriopsis navalis LEGE 11480]
MSSFHSIMGAAAGVLSITCIIPYIISTIKGETQPHRVTWWILSVLGFMMSANHFAAGGTTTFWEPLCAAIGQLCIAILSIRYGKGGWGKLDQICMAGVIASLIVWQQLDSPMLALALTISVDFLACLPTIRKAIHCPQSEDFTCWMMYFISTAINLSAVQQWDLSHAALPVYLFTGNGFILSLLWGNQLHRWEKQYRFVRGVSLYQYDRVLLFHLNGPMMFERSRDINRGRTAMKSADKLVMDFTKVPFVGFRSSRKIATTIRYAHEHGMQVYIVGTSAKIRRQLGRLGLYDIVRAQDIISDSAQALHTALGKIKRPTTFPMPDFHQTSFQLF